MLFDAAEVRRFQWLPLDKMPFGNWVKHVSVPVVEPNPNGIADRRFFDAAYTRDEWLPIYPQIEQ
jgi:hypothetical protein